LSTAPSFPRAGRINTIAHAPFPFLSVARAQAEQIINPAVAFQRWRGEDQPIDIGRARQSSGDEAPDRDAGRQDRE
jgi:hypothetical protein